MKQYRIVPGPKNITIDKGNPGPAFATFADIINREASGGWTYHSMETITLTEKPGCMQQQVDSYSYYMLIFVRDV